MTPLFKKGSGRAAATHFDTQSGLSIPQRCIESVKAAAESFGVLFAFVCPCWNAWELPTICRRSGLPILLARVELQIGRARSSSLSLIVANVLRLLIQLEEQAVPAKRDD